MTGQNSAGKACCAACRRLSDYIFTQEFDPSGAREVMIGQHLGEPRRKLVELPRHSIIVFLNVRHEVLALEIEAKGKGQIIRWQCDGKQRSYSFVNRGNGYGNHDEIRAGDGFNLAGLRKDVDEVARNLRPAFISILSRIQEG